MYVGQFLFYLLGYPAALKLCAAKNLAFPPMQTTYFLSRETIIPLRRITGELEMSIWREQLFACMQRNANSSMCYFHLPVNRVIELDTQVEI